MMRLRMAAISLYCVGQLLVILFSNRPDWLTTGSNEWLNEYAPDIWLYRTSRMSYLMQRYARIVGLDNRWQMFGHQSRFNWWFRIQGVYGEGPEARRILLPDPRQMDRTMWQRNIVDFKEAKFLLNMYGDLESKGAYSAYLARTNPVFEGKSIHAVEWELFYQPIYPIEDAQILHTHLNPTIYQRLQNRFRFEPGSGHLVELQDLK